MTLYKLLMRPYSHEIQVWANCFGIIRKTPIYGWALVTIESPNLTIPETRMACGY